MSSFSTFRLAALFVFSTVSTIAFAANSPALPHPLPPTDGGQIAVTSPALPHPLPPTDGGQIA